MKSVHELNENELEELRSRWFHQHLDEFENMEHEPINTEMFLYKDY